MEVFVKNKRGSVKVFIDEDFLETFNKHRWYLNYGGYIYCLINKKSVLLHRLIMDVLDEKCLIDHKDLNPLNNMKSNLRKCNHSQNATNTHGRGKSKYLGVGIHVTSKKYLSKKGWVVHKTKPKFIAHIRHSGKYHHLGLFENEIDAAKKYDEHAKKYHGEFANLNFK